MLTATNVKVRVHPASPNETVAVPRQSHRLDTASEQIGAL